jgi:hypothetical protein
MLYEILLYAGMYGLSYPTGESAINSMVVQAPAGLAASNPLFICYKTRLVLYIYKPLPEKSNSFTVFIAHGFEIFHCSPVFVFTMDGVSGASAILSVVQIAWQAYTLCRKYYAEVKSARRDILNLNQEVASLAVILTNVSDLANDEDQKSLSCVRLLVQKDGPVQQCQELLHSIISKLDPGENSDEMKRFGKRALEWPFRSKDVERLLALVSKHKASLHIALATDTA